jgi:hypothetical protein
MRPLLSPLHINNTTDRTFPLFVTACLAWIQQMHTKPIKLSRALTKDHLRTFQLSFPRTPHARAKKAMQLSHLPSLATARTCSWCGSYDRNEPLSRSMGADSKERFRESCCCTKSERGAETKRIARTLME